MSLAGNPGTSLHHKIELGIGGDAISRCLGGITCTLQSLLSRFSITSPLPHPHSLFLCTFGQITILYFQKVRVRSPDPAVAPPVTRPTTSRAQSASLSQVVEVFLQCQGRGRTAEARTGIEAVTSRSRSMSSTYSNTSQHSSCSSFLKDNKLRYYECALSNSYVKVRPR